MVLHLHASDSQKQAGPIVPHHVVETLVLV